MPAAVSPARRPPPWLSSVEPDAAGPVGTGAEATGTSRRSAASVARGLRADPWTPAVALVASWSGLVALLWAAAVGAVLGVLVAAGALAGRRTAGLFHVGGAPGLRPWHLAEGALAGAGGTAVAVGGRIFGSPLAMAGWAALGLLVALLGLVAGWRLEAQVLRLGGGRRPSSGELRRIAAASQLAGAPLSRSTAGGFLVVDSDRPFIRAHLEHVVLSTALLDRHDDDELAALVCRARHLQDGGARLRRVAVLACGWPVVGLDALGTRWRRAAVPGLLRASAALALWPARLLASLVASVSARRARLDEYEADAAARAAGLGASLAAVLRADPRPELTAGPLDRALGAGAPAPLRIERLGPRRPLDAFFEGPGADAGATEERRPGVLLLSAVVAAVTIAGAGLSDVAGRAVSPGSATVAAAYTVAYLDAVFDAARTQRVIESALPPGLVPAAERQAGASALGVAARFAAGRPSASRAHALGCRGVASGGRAGRAVVAVEVRWDYAVGPSAHHVVVTGLVPLERSGGRWRPSAVPGLDPALAPGPSSAPFGPCGP